MSERDELHAQYRTPADAADRDRHPAIAIDVASRLWTIGRRADDNRIRRRGRQIERLWLSLERRQRTAHLVERRTCLQRDRNGLRVSVDHRHAVGVRAHGDSVRRDTRVAYGAQSLARLALHLLFFIRDERPGVSE